MADIQVFGVRHKTQKGDLQRMPDIWPDFKPGRNVVFHLFSELKRQGVRRAGIEYLSTIEKEDKRLSEGLSSNDHRYFRAVRIKAEREGIELVELEDTQVQKTLGQVANILSHALSKTNPAETPNSGEIELRVPPDNNCIKSCVVALLSQMPDDLDGQKRACYELGEAIVYKRSLLMLERAREKKVEAVIAGSSHLKDIESTEGVKPNYICPTPELPQQTRDRQQAYERYKPLIDRMVSIISSAKLLKKK